MADPIYAELDTIFVPFSLLDEISQSGPIRLSDFDAAQKNDRTVELFKAMQEAE